MISLLPRRERRDGLDPGMPRPLPTGGYTETAGSTEIPGENGKHHG
ncbi:hypothetical protein [Methanocalculus sp.]|nr:hypothetical protein [Methanocalculus sp.]HIJ05927.1 hypothetical protein [Methanocalculus sp.]